MFLWFWSRAGCIFFGVVRLVSIQLRRPIIQMVHFLGLYSRYPKVTSSRLQYGSLASFDGGYYIT